MKKPAGRLIVLTILCGMFIGIAVGPAAASTMVINNWQVTDEAAVQQNPDIWGDRIVWEDDRNGNWDIYMFWDGQTFEPETQITSHPSAQLSPAIYQDRIVYKADTNWNWDIYLYDLVNQTETQITVNTSVQQNPDIWGDRIVWEDNRNGNWDIYLYDLVNGTERRLTSSGKNTDPAIYGDRVVYIKNDYNVDAIYLPTGVEIHIATIGLKDTISGVSVNIHPSIYDNLIAFGEGHRYWDYSWVPPQQESAFSTQLYDVNLNRIIWYSIPDGWIENSQDISDEYVVWQDNTNWNWDIWIYNYRTGSLTRVPDHAADQVNPKIFGPRIAYQDGRNGNWDIYMAKIGFVPDTPVPSTPPPGTPGTSPGSGPASGALYVASYPSDATILINGTERGHTNQLVTGIAAGNQNLTLIKDGYRPYTMAVTIPAGDVKVLAPITLTKGGPSPAGTGNLYVASYPSNATIFIHGINYGKTDRFVYNVPSGIQNLTLTKDGYQPYTLMVNVPAGDLKVLAPLTLSPVRPPGDCCNCPICMPGTCICFY